MSFETLPKLYREFAEAFGIEATLRLADAKGGTRIYVPRHPGEDNWLSALIGVEAAGALAALYGGEYVTLPANPNGGLVAARRRAERALDEGLSADEAARRSGLHVRSIYHRKAKRRERAQAPDLFSIGDKRDR